MNNIQILKNNQGGINFLKTLDDGRLAAGDNYSNLIIYNKETFKPEIIIKNMIKTSQNNQSIEINFQKELINTYNYMKKQKK